MAKIKGTNTGYGTPMKSTNPKLTHRTLWIPESICPAKLTAKEFILAEIENCMTDDLEMSEKSQLLYNTGVRAVLTHFMKLLIHNG